MGTTYVYDSFFRPYVAKHEPDIDRNLSELKTRAGDYALLYWQKAATYSQTRVFDVLQYIASQSKPKPRSAQLQPQQGTATRVRQPIATRKATAAAQPETEAPASPASGSSSSEAQDDMVEEKEPLEAPKAPSPATAPGTVSNVLRSTVTQTVAVSSKLPPSNEEEAVPIEAALSSTAKEDKTHLQDTVVEDTIPVTRASLRRTTPASSNR